MPILAPETAQQLAIFELGQIFTIHVNKAEISRRLRQKYSNDRGLEWFALKQICR